jgi:hypothetical protein
VVVELVRFSFSQHSFDQTSPQPMEIASIAASQVIAKSIALRRFNSNLTVLGWLLPYYHLHLHLYDIVIRSASGGNCFNCGQPGHRKADCPGLVSGESAMTGVSTGFRSSGSNGACFNCGQTGHRKADCPSAISGSSRPPMTCFK